MDPIAAIDTFSTVAFATALVLITRVGPRSLTRGSKALFALFLLTCVLVGISNILEHTGITETLDFYEDYAEMFFLPVFLTFVYSVAVNNEVRKREISEAALKDSVSPLYRALVEHIDMGVALMDRDYAIVMANTAMGRMFGGDTQEYIGRKCFHNFEKKERACKRCPGAKAMASGRPVEGMAEKIRADGTRFQARINAFPVMDDGGKVSGFVEIVEDISDRLKIEEEMRKAQKLESVGVLAGGIAHDFNNLLTGILGYISMAKINTRPGEDMYLYLSESEKASLRARDLTQQLLTFSKGGVPVTQASSIAEIIRESSSFILSGSNVRCEVVLPEDLWAVEVDGGQISQVIQNVVKNADQAMIEGGTVTIKAENIDVAGESVLPLAPGKYVKIDIVDTGSGIEEENLPKVFDPYFSTKKKNEGSGLGLAVSYSIVSKHHGSISVESKVGSGSTFSVCLPASFRKVSREAEEKVGQALTGGEVLLMDDEEIVLKVASKMLQSLGFQVKTATNGAEAIDLFRDAHESGRPFDAVILDLTVPGGMGGKQAVREILDIDPDARVIVSSGYANDPVMAHFEEYGFRGITPKPYTLEDLGKVLSQVL